MVWKKIALLFLSPLPREECWMHKLQRSPGWLSITFPGLGRTLPGSWVIILWFEGCSVRLWSSKGQEIDFLSMNRTGEIVQLLPDLSSRFSDQNFTAITSLIQKAPLKGVMNARDSILPLWSHNPEMSPRANRPRSWLLKAGLGKPSLPGSLHLLVKALSPCHYSLKPAKFQWERCL